MDRERSKENQEKKQTLTRKKFGIILIIHRKRVITEKQILSKSCSDNLKSLFTIATRLATLARLNQ